jgi:hypothetical protein
LCFVCLAPAWLPGVRLVGMGLCGPITERPVAGVWESVSSRPDPPRCFERAGRALALVALRFTAGRARFPAALVRADRAAAGRLPFRVTDAVGRRAFGVRAFLETALRPDELFRPRAFRAGFLAIVRTPSRDSPVCRLAPLDRTPVSSR